MAVRLTRAWACFLDCPRADKRRPVLVVSGPALAEDLAEPTAEAGDDALAVELVVLGEVAHLGERMVDRRAARARIDHPDQTNPRRQVLADLVEDGALGVARREHL